ncbi:uncharacterized protein J7T54_004166 [Emericellopsis cladophorae]|uniref:AB hydrolase-1 domain-containing protein n=1 Tax=Emericellopsis cladophorae TaxID=2686198 RepID=A0A9P9XVQ3_9HYPO|nr:uncharacterized protein J7T54_004166 [Emericellopsis cladophorae]KAI6778259.1 hypothetical protein J7T54_004166 [Emericellopsis cladophorae]
MFGDHTAALDVMTLLNTMAVTAQNTSFGADNFYRSNNVQIQPIMFPTLYRTDVAGNLFLPRNLSRSVENPVIVVGHPMGAVKERSANLYATKLAEDGFATVSIHLPHWGGSKGDPRNAVSAEYYAEAFSAAVDYLGLQDFVNPSMYDMGAVTRNGLENSQTLAQRELFEAAVAQRWNESEGAEPELVGGTVNRRQDATDPIQQEFHDFYCTTRGEVAPLGALPSTMTHPMHASQVKFLNFYPVNEIDTISPRPLLFITGDQAHSREFSQDGYNRAAEPKELIWVPGAGHVDLYDRVELIPFDRLGRFFRSNL